LAVGQYGIRPNDFWDLTLYEFCLIQDGYLKKAQSEYQTKWEQTRWLGYCAMRPHFKITVEELMPFNWEKKQSAKDFIMANLETFDRIFPDKINE